MKKKKYKVEKIIKELSRYGFCVINDVLSIKKCNSIKENLEKLLKKTQKNKFFFDEGSERGQLIIRDLPLRDPKNYLDLIDNKLILDILDNIFKETFILDGCVASKSINVKENFKSLVHIDSHLASKDFNNTSDIVVCFCFDEFTKENGATKVWPKSHLSGTRIQKSKEYDKKIKNSFRYAEAKKGSAIIFLGHTWHQIGKNSNSLSRWGCLNQYKRWWIKPSTDFTKCGAKIFKMLNQRQKELFGFSSISPRFDFKKNTRTPKTLRKLQDLSLNYTKAVQFK